MLDGVYLCDADGAPTFVEAGEPIGEEMHAMLMTLISGPMKLLTRRGVPVEEMGKTSLSGRTLAATTAG